MSLSLAVIIVLGVAVVGLGLACYALFARLHLLETAISGGMGPASGPLTGEEFAHRFAIARARSDFASTVGTGVVLFVDTASDSSNELLRALDHLPHPRGFTVAYGESAPADTPAGVAVLENVQKQLAVLGVPVTPYCLVIDDSRIVHASAVAGSEALAGLLAEVT